MQNIRHQGSFRFIFASLLFISMPALSAAPSWQGPYVSAYLGGGFGNNHASTNAGPITSSSYFTTAADANAVNSAGTSTQNPSAIIGGIQAGHDWVWKQIVYGVALDYSILPLSSTKNANNRIYPDNANTYSVGTSISTNWLFTLRGRVGYPTLVHCWPSLVYVTGGMAMTQVMVKNNFSDNSSYSGLGSSHNAENQIGLTGGIGIELASFEHATIDLEYLYVKVPSLKTTSYVTNTQGGFGVPAQSLTSPLSTTGSFHASLFKIALNYRFGE